MGKLHKILIKQTEKSVEEEVPLHGANVKVCIDGKEINGIAALTFNLHPSAAVGELNLSLFGHVQIEGLFDDKGLVVTTKE
jgi:hypothetical protein